MFTYLLINLFSIAIPFACSFEKRIQFAKDWKKILSAIFLPGLIFLVWDSLFTNWGIWGFNEAYLTGFKIFNLPVEEILFFFCIPYACLFTHQVLKYFFPVKPNIKLQQGITLGCFLVSIAFAIWHHELSYTFWTSVGCAVFLALHGVVLRRNYILALCLSFLVILIPFFIVNGILTGTGIEGEVVWYNNLENLGIRLVTIPIEDVAYAFLLIGLNITVFEELAKKAQTKKAMTD